MQSQADHDARPIALNFRGELFDKGQLAAVATLNLNPRLARPRAGPARRGLRRRRTITGRAGRLGHAGGWRV